MVTRANPSPVSNVLRCYCDIRNLPMSCKIIPSRRTYKWISRDEATYYFSAAHTRNVSSRFSHSWLFSIGDKRGTDYTRLTLCDSSPGDNAARFRDDVPRDYFPEYVQRVLQAFLSGRSIHGRCLFQRVCKTPIDAQSVCCNTVFLLSIFNTLTAIRFEWKLGSRYVVFYGFMMIFATEIEK